MDISRIAQEDEDHSPEYYHNLKDDPESNDENEDYKDSSLSLIHGMEDRFRQSAPMSFFCQSFSLVYITNLEDLQVLLICRQGR